MSPQKDDEGQVVVSRRDFMEAVDRSVQDSAARLIVGIYVDRIEERVRVLEEALREAEWTAHAEGLAEDMHCGVCLSRQDEGHEQDCSVRRALLSPAAATEGGEGA